MFQKLNHPGLPFQADLIKNLFGEQVLNINGYDYRFVVVEPTNDAVAEAVSLSRRETEYALIVTRSGEHFCSCKAFEYSTGRPCKHLCAAYHVGLLTQHRPHFPQPEINHVDAAPTDATADATTDAGI